MDKNKLSNSPRDNKLEEAEVELRALSEELLKKDLEIVELTEKLKIARRKCK